MRVLIALLAIALGLTSASVGARYSEEARVRYVTSDGPSKWYTVEVNFLTGSELNKATRTQDYDFLEDYAIIFWGEDQASVILIEEPFMMCSVEFRKTCLPLLGKMKGSDQEGRVWEICTATFC